MQYFSRIFTSVFYLVTICHMIMLEADNILFGIMMSDIDNRKHLLDLYESGVQSATILCDKTNIPTFNIYDNCKNFW